MTILGAVQTFDPTVQEVAGSLKGYWKTTIQQHPCVPMAINRVVQILLPVPVGPLASYPSVPVMMNSTPHHAPLSLVDGQPACYSGSVVP